MLEILRGYVKFFITFFFPVSTNLFAEELKELNIKRGE